ncbi:MAG TPA: WG repeat-containing protein [Bacteroidia bacterium]|nr:WG repeat-containing protein [Bacteroidia bacterium]
MIKPKFYVAHPFSGPDFDNQFTQIEYKIKGSYDFQIIDKTGKQVSGKFGPGAFCLDRYLYGHTLFEGDPDDKSYVFDLKNGNFIIFPVILPRDFYWIDENKHIWDQRFIAYVDDKTKKVGLVRTSDMKNIHNPEYDKIWVSKAFPATLIVKQAGLYGLADTSLAKPIDFKYEGILFAKYPYVIIKQKGLYGLMDLNFKQTVDCKYQNIRVLGDDSLMAASSEGKRMINFHDHQLQSFKYDEKSKTDGGSGLYAARKGDRWGFLNASDSWVIDPKYLAAREFSKGGKSMIRLENKKYTFINTKGEVIGKYQYDDYNESHDLDNKEPCAVMIDGAWKFQDLTTESLYTIGAGPLGSYDEKGMFPIEIRNGWGWIDKAGKLVIPARFSKTTFDEFGLAIVRSGNRYGLINRQGKNAVTGSTDDFYDYDNLTGAAGEYSTTSQNYDGTKKWITYLKVK